MASPPLVRLDRHHVAPSTADVDTCHAPTVCILARDFCKSLLWVLDRQSQIVASISRQAGAISQARECRVGLKTGMSTDAANHRRHCCASRDLRDPCHNVGPVFLEPGHGLRSIDDALEGFPGWVLQGF